MDSIVNKHCNLCDLCFTAKNICIAGKGAKESTLMIIAEMPSWYDEDNDTVLGNPVSRMVDRIITEVLEYDISVVYKTHLVKCKTPESRKPTDTEISRCMTYLEQEIKEVKPKVILALGDIVLNHLTGGKLKPSMIRGQVQLINMFKGDEKQTIKVIGTYSPYYVDKVQSKMQDFATDIMKAYHIAQDISSVASTKIVICDTVAKVKQAVAYCKEVGVCSFDFETHEIDEDKGTFAEDFKATSLSLSFQAGSSYVIPLEHFESPYSTKDVHSIMAYIGRHLFANKNVRKIGHNLSYDTHVARVYGCIDFRGRLDDTMLMHHLYDETKKHGLKELVAEYLPEFAGYEDSIKGYKWHEVPYSLLAPYNGADTDLTLRLSTQLENYLLEDEKVYRIYRNLTMAAMRPLWNAERRGMLIDDVFLANAIKEVRELIRQQEDKLQLHSVYKRYVAAKRESMNYEMIAELQNKLDACVQKRNDKADELAVEYELVSDKRKVTLSKQIEALRSGAEITKTEQGIKDKIKQLKTGELTAYSGFNFGSWQQLEDLFYDSEFGFRFPTLTRGTGKAILEDLNDDSGFIEQLLLLRTLEKMCGTYLEGLWNRMDKDKRVHTQLLLHGTVSGRLSSRNPNLQNIPNLAKLKDEVAIHVVSLIKKCFKCPENFKIQQTDYSQAELRIIAAFAEDSTMLGAYNRGEDLHALTGSKLLKTTLEEFYKLDPKAQKEARTRAKAGNFGLIYGMGVEGFMDYAKKNYRVLMSKAESTEFRRLFFDLYDKLLDYHEIQIAKARKFKWVRTLYGRRRRTPEIDNRDDYKRSEEERVAINSPVQGTAGEFTIFAIALLQHRLDPRVELAITVHDSIIFYIPLDIYEESTAIIKKTCENLPNMQYFLKDITSVKMKVDQEESTTSWKDLEPLKLIC